MNDRYPRGDIVRTIQARLLGVRTQPEHLKGLLALQEPRDEPEYDMLVIPDAKGIEIDSSERPIRSQKSLSKEQWASIGAKLPTDWHYGVVRGSAHPEYCDAVYEAVRRRLPIVQYIATETLDEFIKQVLNAGRIVCMDTGTSHLASEAIRSLNGYDRILLREIYNGNLPEFHVREWGIRGHAPGGGRILVSRYSLDILPAEEIAEFIMS